MDIEEILKKFEKAVFYRRVSNVIIILSVIFAWFIKGTQSIVPIIIFIIAEISAIVLNVVFWRCPACGRQLPLREPSRKIVHCHHCGNRLQP